MKYALIIMLVVLVGCASQGTLQNSMNNIERMYEVQTELLREQVKGAEANTAKIAALKAEYADLQVKNREAIQAVADSAKENADNFFKGVASIVAGVGSILGVGGIFYRKHLLNIVPTK